MPFVEDRQNVFEEDQLTPYASPPPEESVNWTDVIGPAMRQENITANLLAREQPMRRDLSYNPWDNMQGYEDFSDYLEDAGSPEEMARMKSTIDQQMEDRKLLAASGWKGVVASIGAAVLDPAALPLWFVPVGGGVRGAKLAASVAGVATAEAAISEAALHANQPVRTIEESLLNVGASALFGSGLGVAAARLTPPEFAREVTEMIADDFVDAPVKGPSSVGAAEVRGLSPEKIELVGGATANRAARINPIGRLVTSPVAKARELGSRLFESAHRFRGAEEGVATAQAVETKIKRWTVGVYSRLYRDTHRGYRKYKKAGGDLSEYQFRREVGHVMHGGQSDVAEAHALAAKWREQLFNPLGVRAKEAKLIEGLEENYLMRKYDPVRLREFEGTDQSLANRLIRYWDEQGSELSELEMRAAANEIERSLKGESAGTLSHWAQQLAGKSGAQYQRTLNVPYEVVADFLETDVDIIGGIYARSMGARVELANASIGRGKANAFEWTDDIDEMLEEFNKAIGEAKTPAEKARLESQRIRAEEDLKVGLQRLLSTYDMPADPTAWVSRVPRYLKSMNFLSMMGGMTVSALPDMARLAFQFGFRGSYGKLVANTGTIIRNWGDNLDTLQKFGTAVDMIQSARIRALADLDDLPPVTKFERGLDKVSRGFTRVTGMDSWNTTWKGLTGLLGQDQIGGIVAKLRKGQKLTKREISDMAHLGLDEDMLTRISRQPWRQDEKLWLANVNDWGDDVAAEAYGAALVKLVDNTIITPGAGDIPAFIKGDWLKLLVQFKSFMFAAHSRMTMPAMQMLAEGDRRVYSGILLSLALGAIVSPIKKQLSGRGDEMEDWDEAKYLAEAIDRSGLLGPLMEMNNIAEKFSGGRLGLNAVLGNEPMSRYASRTWYGSLLGPGVSQMEALPSGINILAGDATRSDARQFMKIMPARNLWAAQQLINHAEDEFAKSIGAQETRR